MADKLGTAYSRIANDATVSLADQRKAFDQWAASAIAANAGVESASVSLARSILETREALAGAGDVGEDAGVRIGRGFRDAIRDIRDATDALDVFSAAGQRASNASNLSTQQGPQYDGQGFATDGNGRRISIGGQAAVGEGQTYDKAAFDRDHAAYLRGAGGNKEPDPTNPRYVVGGGVQTGDDFHAFRTKPLPFGPAMPPAPAGPTATPSGSTTQRSSWN